MSEIVPNPQMNEINLFKNEIYGLIRELETKLTSKINITEKKLFADLENYETKINSLMGNTKEMVISLVSQNLKLEKITELEKFKQKADAQMITHELRIKNNLEEIISSYKNSKIYRSLNNSPATPILSFGYAWTKTVIASIGKSYASATVSDTFLTISLFFSTLIPSFPAIVITGIFSSSN